MPSSGGRTLRRKFSESVREYRLWTQKDRLLVGVSGGPDSVALAHLALETGLPIALSHVNYGLRDQDSEADEALVVELARLWEVPLFILDARDFAARSESAKSGLQEAARARRYSWWKELLREQGYTRVLTGHQADDQLETLLINMVRGSGLAGWKGIPIQNGPICRPLLLATREEILEYLEANALAWREDRSNRTQDYLRNRIRHTVVPALASLRPRLAERASMQSLRTASALDAARWAAESLRQAWMKESEDRFRITLGPWRELPLAGYVLHEWLAPKGFTPDQTEGILSCSPTSSGQGFLSTDWRIIHERGRVHGERLQEDNTPYPVIIDPASAKTYLFPSGTLSVEMVDRLPDPLPKNPHRLFLSLQSMGGGITMRPWRPGDRMAPLGSPGSRKVKDILTDLKISGFTREGVMALEMDGKILWLAGILLDKEADVRNKQGPWLALRWENRPDL